MTCHIDYPKLNDFGKAFKDAGFQFPKDDESEIKIPPVMLGAEAQKQNFPKSVWPGTIPGIPPIAFRYASYFQATGANRNRFNAIDPQSNPIPATDFSSGTFTILSAGNFGGNIAFWIDDDISVGGNPSAGGLGDAYLRFVNVSRFLKLPKDSFNVRIGEFELDLPITQARTYNLSDYDIYGQANIGATNPLVGLQQNVANQLTLADPMKGIELSGGHQYGGYHYSVAVFDQNTIGLDQAENTSPYVPSPAGFGSSSEFKNVYGRFSYRFNLERDSESRHDIQAAGATGPHDHTYFTLGSYYLYGKSLQRFAGADSILNVEEPYFRTGGDFNFNYRRFNMYGVFMHGRDHNLLPVDSDGNLIPLPIVDGSPAPVGFIKSVPARFTGGFVQADFMIHPWIMAIMRWDAVNSSADRINGLALSTATPFFAPVNSTRNRFTPGIQFLIHPNIKLSFEYQIRPEQTTAFATDPVTGRMSAVNPFRVNTALFSLDFVY